MKRAVGKDNKQLSNSSGNYGGDNVQRTIAVLAAAAVAMAAAIVAMR